MKKLIDTKPKRIFTFGCSFTKYFWTTWPELIADAVDVPFYNFGRSGAGNQYIANVLMQTHKRYNITNEDMVILSWTNVCREDRWAKGNWLLTGNVYSQGIYDDIFVDKFADPVGYYIRDLPTMNFVKMFLEHIGCQHHFLSMCNILERQDQGEDYNLIEERYRAMYEHVANLYKDVTDVILPSFYEILWNDNIHQNKFELEKQNITPLFLDGHPTPIEHWRFIKTVFDYDWPFSTEEKVKVAQENYEQIIKDLASKYKKNFVVYDQPKEILDNLREKTLVKQSLPVRHI